VVPLHIYKEEIKLHIVPRTFGLPQFHRGTKGTGPMARSEAGAILLRDTNRPFLSFTVKGVAAKRSLRSQIAAGSVCGKT